MCVRWRFSSAIQRLSVIIVSLVDNADETRAVDSEPLPEWRGIDSDLWCAMPYWHFDADRKAPMTPNLVLSGTESGCRPAVTLR